MKTPTAPPRCSRTYTTQNTSPTRVIVCKLPPTHVTQHGDYLQVGSFLCNLHSSIHNAKALRDGTPLALPIVRKF